MIRFYEKPKQPRKVFSRIEVEPKHFIFRVIAGKNRGN